MHVGEHQIDKTAATKRSRMTIAWICGVITLEEPFTEDVGFADLVSCGKGSSLVAGMEVGKPIGVPACISETLCHNSHTGIYSAP